MKLFDWKPLTLEIIKELNFPKEILEDLCLQHYDNDQWLLDSDYIFAFIRYLDQYYIFVHGFPGDNPVGIIRSQDGKEYYMVGELAQFESNSVFEKWYNEKTNNCTNYKDSFWYTSSKSD